MIKIKEIKNMIQHCSDDTELFVSVNGNKKPLRLVSITATSNESSLIIVFSDELPNEN